MKITRNVRPSEDIIEVIIQLQAGDKMKVYSKGQKDFTYLSGKDMIEYNVRVIHSFTSNKIHAIDLYVNGRFICSIYNNDIDYYILKEREA